MARGILNGRKISVQLLTELTLFFPHCGSLGLPGWVLVPTIMDLNWWRFYCTAESKSLAIPLSLVIVGKHGEKSRENSLVPAQERKSFFRFKAQASSQALGIMETAGDGGDESLTWGESGSQNSRHFKVSERWSGERLETGSADDDETLWKTCDLSSALQKSLREQDELHFFFFCFCVFIYLWC